MNTTLTQLQTDRNLKFTEILLEYKTDGLTTQQCIDELNKAFCTHATDPIFEQQKADAITYAQLMHGSKYYYELRFGTEIDLPSLKKGQSVCASNVKGYHILMTEK